MLGSGTCCGAGGWGSITKLVGPGTVGVGAGNSGAGPRPLTSHDSGLCQPPMGKGALLIGEPLVDALTAGAVPVDVLPDLPCDVLVDEGLVFTNEKRCETTLD